MKKKISIILAIIALIAGCAGLFALNQSKKIQGSKTITYTFEVKGEVLLETKQKTEATTLADALKELDANKEIVLQYEDSSYGMFITGIGIGDQMYAQDQQEGLFWTYNSVNNKECVAATYCDAADLVHIEDGDSFDFQLNPYE